MLLNLFLLLFANCINFCQLGEVFEKFYFHLYVPEVLNSNGVGTFTIRKLSKISIQTCFEKCKFTRECNCVNFHIRSHTCFMINSCYDIRMTRFGQYIFGKKSDWDLSDVHSCSGCEDYQTCDISLMPRCKTTGCGIPNVSNGTNLSGNMYAVGSTLYFTCNSGYTGNGTSNITCKADGQWSTLQTCFVDLSTCPLTPNYGETTLSDGTKFKYWLVEVSHTQSEALATCLSCQGRLVEILLEPKLTFLRNLLMERGYVGIPDFWIDGSNLNASDFFADDAWTTTSGATVPLPSQLWVPGRPNKQGTQHCIRMKGEDGYYLDDHECLFELYFICERN